MLTILHPIVPHWNGSKDFARVGIGLYRLSPPSLITPNSKSG